MIIAQQVKPRKWIPRPYMRTSVRFLLSHGGGGLWLDPGLGKTSCVLSAFSRILEQRTARKMLVIAPRRVCTSVWPKEAAKWTQFTHLKVAVLHGTHKEEALYSDADIYCINPEGLAWLLERGKHRFEKLGVDVLTIDECFPCGTKISTPNGSTNIEDLHIGDLVMTDNGAKKVSSVMCRESNDLVTLETEDGRKLTSTATHPVFTRRGWMPAEYALGQNLMDIQGVSDLQASVCHEKLTERSVLHTILRSEEGVGGQREVAEEGGICMQGEFHGREFVEQRYGDGRSVGSEDQGDSNRSERAWRKWDWDDPVRETTECSFADRVHMELRNKIGWEASRLSHMLQGGLRQPENEARDRSGRRITRIEGEKTARQKERSEVERARVVSVTHHEQGGATKVWNIEVAGTPHFYADGFLVHNCTKFKHTDTARFKLLKPYLAKFRRRWTLTGTPAPNGLMDIFGQIYCLDLGHSLGAYITQYRNKYFDASGFGGYDWEIKEGAEEKIYKKIRPLILRISNEVLGDELPKLVFNNIRVKLPDDAMRVYNDMEQYLLTMFDDGLRVNAVSAGVAAGKCLQIANGGLYYQEDKGVGEVIRKKREIHTAKVEAVVDLVNDLMQTPAIILYSFDHDRERLKAAFPAAPCVADLSDKKCDEMFDKWNRGQVPVMLAQPQSIGHGLNLQGGGQHIIWFGLPWDLEIWIQAIDRLHRQGSSFDHIFVHCIMAEGTIDEVVRATISAKDMTQRALLSAMHTYRKTGQLPSVLDTEAVAEARKAGRFAFTPLKRSIA